MGCPECGEPIEIKLDKNKEPVAHKVAAEEPTPDSKLPPRVFGKSKRLGKKRKEKKSRSKTTNASESKPASESPGWATWKPLLILRERIRGVAEALSTPVGIAWTVAGIVGMILIIMAWPGTDEAANRPSPDSLANASASADDQVHFPFENDVFPEPLPELPDEDPAQDPNLLAAKFSHLYAGIESYVDERGHYPQGSMGQGTKPVDERFSWLAELFVHGSQGKIAEPQWDQPWNDPLNDRFVRQPQDGYLNPFLADRAGADRYPATHFVGVAGVGHDAPGLKANHPRAGIFGTDRVTRPEDIRDGQANTMMVAGVRNHLGSWAAGGHPTIRPFTQEPYFDGPDGFGTGEADGMSVLMADGSVRFLSKDISPLVVRRMAAMADGWPLDETISGEPGESPMPKREPEKSQPMDPPAVAKADPLPKEVTTQKPEPLEEPSLPKQPEPEPQTPPDIPAALAVKIVKFEQVQNVPLKELLFQVEELAGVPIRLADDAPANDDAVWNQGVSLRLKDTTVGDILNAILQKANLSYTIESDHIRLQKKP